MQVCLPLRSGWQCQDGFFFFPPLVIAGIAQCTVEGKATERAIPSILTLSRTLAHTLTPTPDSPSVLTVDFVVFVLPVLYGHHIQRGSVRKH